MKSSPKHKSRRAIKYTTKTTKADDHHILVDSP
jgi:hypothetical protein